MWRGRDFVENRAIGNLSIDHLLIRITLGLVIYRIHERMGLFFPSELKFAGQHSSLFVEGLAAPDLRWIISSQTKQVSAIAISSRSSGSCFLVLFPFFS